MTILEEPPEPEGDDTEAGGGKPVAPPTDDEIEDAPELDEGDYEEPGDEPDA